MALELEPLDAEIRTNGPATFEAKPCETKYKGLEHRLQIRRTNSDRRTLFRFEPDKNDRRSITDRRAGGAMG